MYAVIESGGKQYKVQKGTIIDVEKLDMVPGVSVRFSDLLLVVDGTNVRVGAPFVTGGVVHAEVQGHGRGKKIKVVKFRRRKHYRRQMGHRQHYTRLAVTGIDLPASS